MYNGYTVDSILELIKDLKQIESSPTDVPVHGMTLNDIEINRLLGNVDSYFPYTHSIDSAMTMVPARSFISMYAHHESTVYVINGPTHFVCSRYGRPDRIALNIAILCLEARFNPIYVRTD